MRSIEYIRGPGNKINIKGDSLKAVFDVFLAVSGRSTIVHNCFPVGVRRFVRRTGDRDIYRMYFMLRNSASGPEIRLPGRMLAAKAGRMADVGAFPVAVRPKSGPEGRFRARKHDCVTSSLSGGPETR